MLYETNLSPKYGTLLTRFGKWIVTSKGILFQDTDQEDHFTVNATIHQLSAMQRLLETLLNETKMEAMDYHEFITAWLYKLSLLTINPDPDQPSLADTLAGMQQMLEKKFGGTLSQL